MTAKDIDPEVLNAIKAQVIEELKNENKMKEESAKAERERQLKIHEDYVEQMKDSTEPWVDVTGWSETDQGVRVELEWNDAFVNYLRKNGVKGADEEQVVQHWVTLLLRDMADKMDEDGSSEYE